MRIVCSPQLSPDDIEALHHGYAKRDVISDSLIADIQAALREPSSRPVTEFLATLVAFNTLDVRLAYRPTAAGIFHDKVGIFRDVSRNAVTFVGSANETFSAWDHNANHESFEVFQSWKSDFDNERVTRHLAAFDDLWNGKERDLVVRTFPDAAQNELIQAANIRGIDEAAHEVRKAIKLSATRSHSSTHVRETSNETYEVRTTLPPRILQPHQLQAVANWNASGGRGIITHVTGGGKTVTALAIIADWIRAHKPVLVVVPSDVLVTQWRREVKRELADTGVAVLVAGAGFDRSTWQHHLPDFTRDMPDLGPRLTIATTATAASEHFLKNVVAGQHLLLVADEVHRIGSAGYRSILTIDAGGRLGLSATPERYGDSLGTSAIFAYFGSILPPLFDIPAAIAAGRLVPYDYFVYEVVLSNDEQERWDRITKRIQAEYAKLPKTPDGSRQHTDRFRRLLFDRATILKRAAGKVDLAIDIVVRSYKTNDRWLVYCDTQDQLRLVLEGMRAAGLPAHEYHSAMDGSRVATLDHFVHSGGVLIAIRCLDEGVDIPMVNRAVILASSTNMREFIQRRGRVLRAVEGKYSAEIHDMLVVPERSLDDDNDRRSIVGTELRRAAQFAMSARNTSVQVELEMLARAHDVDDFAITTSDVEEKD